MKSLAESGGVRSTTRARSWTSRPATHSDAASDCTDDCSVSSGGAWYSGVATAPTYGGNVATSTGLAVLIFFSSRRRHTRFDCDWSSDVCSSDLELCCHRRVHRPADHTAGEEIDD